MVQEAFAAHCPYTDFCTNFPENMLMFLGKEADIFLKTIASV